MSKATVTFAANDQGLSTTIRKIDGDMGKMKSETKSAASAVGMSFKKMAGAAAGLAVGIGAVKLGFAAARKTIQGFSDAIDMGGRLNDLSASTGETAGNLLILERAFQNSGSSAEAAGGSINKMQKFLNDAKMGIKMNNDVLEELGINLEEISKKSPIEQIGMLAEKFAAIENDTKRAGLAMNVFGRSGGKLIPLLRNFGSEVGTAKSELGSLARIMDEKNVMFDNLADRMAVVKGKFTEFAAGILSQVLPALELMSTYLSRIDAAGIGEKLAKSFVGAQSAMTGFSTALDALKAGEFGDAWNLSIISIKLQAKQTVNEIINNVKSGIAASAAFLVEMFGPTSSAWSMVKASFDVLAASFSIGISKGLIPVLESIPGFGAQMAEKIEGNLALLANNLKNAKNIISNSIETIDDDMARAGKAFAETFTETYENSDPFLSVKEDMAELTRIKNEFNLKNAGNNENPFKKELDDLFKGVMPAIPQSAGKGLFDMNFTIDDMDLAAMNSDQIKQNLKDAKDSMEKAAKSLVLSVNLTKELKEAEAKNAVDKGGRLEAKFKGQLEGGQTKGAAKTIERIKQAEDDAALRTKEDGTLDKRNIKDIAKAEGISTIRKTDAELRKEILELRKGIDSKYDEIAREGNGGRDPGAAGEPKADPQNDILTTIKEMLALLTKIEPKLPTAALGL
jgi:hypothetical protein